MEHATDPEDTSPGPRAAEKSGPTADPPHPQPEGMEVESARLLANEARDTLEGRGLQEDEIRRLADEFIALDRGQDVATFIEWATEGGRARGTG
jgi:hypothetical protein